MDILNKIVKQLKEEEMLRSEARRKITNFRITKDEADEILERLDAEGKIKLSRKKVITRGVD